MRLVHRSLLPTACAGTMMTTGRFMASYGKTLLSHAEVVEKFGPGSGDGGGKRPDDELALLEIVEHRIRNWKLNKWEFRVPVLLSQTEKEVAQQQLHKIKMLVLDHAKTMDLIDHDVSNVCQTLNITPEALRGKSRSWLQEQVADLRWKGEVAKAKSVREAFARLETYGSRDFRYFERLCCIYGIAKLGTFEDAFRNFVVPSESNGVKLDTSSPFHDLMRVLVTKYPSLDIIFDFLGFNELEGYRSSLGRYLRLGLAHKYANGTEAAALAAPRASSRVLFQHAAGTPAREVLFDFHDSAKAVAGTDATHGVADFVHVRNNDLTLITIASSNRWLRSRQAPHRKQLEGIGRRASFVMQMPYDETRIRHLLLPPSYLDRASLDRLNDRVLGLGREDLTSFAPWVQLYEKELDVARDADFADMAKTKPEEDWVTL